MEQALAIAAGAVCRSAFIRRFDATALDTARAADARRAAGVALPPLAGMPVSVKDLFDVAGQPTTAGSLTLENALPAKADSAAVARLRAAGAALVGHTNMTEFAYSGVGINPHFGTPVNPATRDLDPRPRIPGGSTSGGAVSVASGAAVAALGSDTGGSIRIPAALQGLVGFKNTQRLTPLAGAIPLSTALDTACAMTRNVGDAALMHAVLAGTRRVTTPATLRGLRLAIPTTLMLNDLEPAVARAFERALVCLRDSGATVDEIDLSALAEPASVESWRLASAQAWTFHRHRLPAQGELFDPRVAARIRRGGMVDVADYIDLLGWRQDWSARVGSAMAGYGAMLSPTVPVVAPLLDPLIESDERFFATNAALLRNPAVVNLLDGCALSLPCQRHGEFPVGLMVWADALADDRVLAIALAIEDVLCPVREA
jgi:amidase/aspartyl-tRNA(Asn)/glutamyl-tRNA(Gln) amidotransferase subunit A